MKQISKMILVALVATTSMGIAKAQTPKFGHFNSVELMTSLPERQKIQDDLQKYANLLESQQKAMQDELNKKYDDYLAKRDSLPSVVKATQEKDIQNLQERISTFNQMAPEDLHNKELELTKPLLDKLQKAISEVGKENGYTYIFDLASRTVVYHSEQSEDITPLLKKKLGVQ